MTDRIISGAQRLDEGRLERTLRPHSLGEFVGQQKIKERLGIFIQAAKARGEPLEHVLFTGPPGLGKTTLANIMAAEMGVAIRTTSGPAIEHQGELAAILTRLSKGDVLFIDEIHRLSRAVEEILYPAMEDFLLDIVVGKGPTAQNLRLPLKPFTIVAATTRPAMMTAPLRDRFGVIYSLDYYDPEALHQIVLRSAHILGVQVEDDGAREIARRARGTPRIANRLLKRVRDYAQVRADGVITFAVAIEALEQLEVDRLGLDEIDRKMLGAIVHKFGGGPVGLESIAAATSEESDTIMDVYEPYLLRLGFIARTPRGRVATRLAYDHLGVPAPSPALQPGLFDSSGGNGGT